MIKRHLNNRLTGIAAFAAMLLLPFAAQAGDIVGKAVDANNGNFLPGALIRLTDQNRSTRSDRDGNFRFSNLGAGSYTIEVSYLGYDAVSQTVQVPETGNVSARVSVGQEVVDLEEFVIEGYREGRSLALQQKRTASSLRDIISADSIGNLPDQNVAEALVRVPGVSIQLAQGEGRFVSIRGIAPELNNVTINGANIANPSVGGRAGRSVPLDVVGSSQVSQLEVIKAVTPDMDGQGLGGTVNIITASGFDSENGFFNGAFEAGVNNLNDDGIYRFQATYGNRFGDEKNFAIAASASWEERSYQTEAVDIRFRSGIDADTDGDGDFDSELTLPSSVEIVPEVGRRRRVGFNTKIEYRPDDSTEFSFNAIVNNFTQWDNEIEDIFELDERDYFFVSPTQAFSSTSEIRARRFITRTEQQLINLTFAGKKTWGNLTARGEITYSYQQEDDLVNNNIQFRARDRDGQMRLRDGETLTEINGVPLPTGSGDVENLCGGDGVCEEGDSIPVLVDMSRDETVFTSGFADHDPTRFVHWRNQVNDSLSEETTWVPRVDLTWDTDNFLGSGNTGFLKWGVKYFDRDRVVDDTDLRTNGAENSEGDEETIASVNDAFPGSFNNGRDTLSYNTDLELVFTPVFHGFFAGNPDGTGSGACCDDEASQENSVEDDYIINEKIFATYVMASVDFGERLNILGGVRYERTDGTYQAFQFTRGRERYDGGADDLLNITSISGNRVYNHVLPNIQMRYELRDDLLFRASVTTTIGRPDFEDAAPISRLRWDEEEEDDTGFLLIEGYLRVRNPQLIPYEAVNFDASVEYYLESGGLLAVAFFHKEIDNPIYAISGKLPVVRSSPGSVPTGPTVAEAIAVVQELGGAAFNPDGLELTDVFGSGIEWESFANADHGSITGVELTATIPFTFMPSPLDGFGVETNVSVMTSSVDVVGRETEDLPFFNQPDMIANVALFYQKGRISGRVAFRYQDSEIDELEGDSTVDQWRSERRQWDAQLSYRVNDHWKVFANLQNFTNETDDSNHGNVPFNLKDREKFGATYRFGVGWNY